MEDGISSDENRGVWSCLFESVCPYVNGCCLTLVSKYKKNILDPSSPSVAIPITIQAQNKSEN